MQLWLILLVIIIIVIIIIIIITLFLLLLFSRAARVPARMADLGHHKGTSANVLQAPGLIW